MTMPNRTRIAPSPTGFPHVGTVFQGVIDFVLARQNDGQFVIRIEDTDQNRKVEGAEEAIYKSLAWAGISPDEGPLQGGDFGPYRQSERLDIYQKHAQQLIENGHAYYCFCSSERLADVRAQMQKEGKPPMYDKHCRHLDPTEAAKRAQNEASVVRMKIPADTKITFSDEIRGEITFESNTVDDQVILKSDGFPTYHLAVVVDDHLMEITHVIRGEEWISSTPKHVLLYQYLQWDMPKLIHTPLLRNPDKSKLSKRHGHASVSWYQDQGYLPEALVNFLTTRVWNHPEGKEVFGIEETIKHFKPEDMNIQGPIADLSKLDWFNGLYIRQLEDQELAQRLKPFADERLSIEKLQQILPLIKERLVKLSDITELTDFFIKDIPYDSSLLLKKADAPLVKDQLSQVSKKLEQIQSWSTGEIETSMRDLQEANDWHKGQFFMMVRIGVTGKKATPPLFETMEVLGKELVLARLAQAENKI